MPRLLGVEIPGDKRIEADPEHWADQTMWDLLDAISGKKKGSG